MFGMTSLDMLSEQRELLHNDIMSLKMVYPTYLSRPMLSKPGSLQERETPFSKGKAFRNGQASFETSRSSFRLLLGWGGSISK